MTIDHPILPEIPWRFAISRRFRSSYAEEVYQKVIKPVLTEEGVVLECFFASDAPSSKEFWINRMNLIFELSHFHILLNIDPTPNTVHEIEKSLKIRPWRSRPTLAKLIGKSDVEMRILGKPNVLLIEDIGTANHTFKNYKTITLLSFSKNTSVQDFQEKLRKQIRLAKQRKSREITKYHSLFQKWFPRIFSFLGRVMSIDLQHPYNTSIERHIDSFENLVLTYDCLAKLIYYDGTINEIEAIVEISEDAEIPIFEVVDRIQQYENTSSALRAIYSVDKETEEVAEPEEFTGNDNENDYSILDELETSINQHHSFNLNVKQSELQTPKKFLELNSIYKEHYKEILPKDLNLFSQLLGYSGNFSENSKSVRLLSVYCAFARSVQAKIFKRKARGKN